MSVDNPATMPAGGAPTAVQVLRRRFSVEQYHRMAEAGILAGDDRVELIEGEIVEMSPIGRLHAALVDRLLDLLMFALGRRVIIRVQGPIRLGSHSEPQPDLVVLRRREDFYAQALPGPDDVLLAIEVADSSLDFDRSVKVPLYARMGIPEAWVVDLIGELVEVSRNPSPQGYLDVRRVRRGESLSPAAFPDVSLSVTPEQKC